MPETRSVHVLIVGGGFAGLGAAIKLKQSGRNDFVVIERGSDVGGTWRDNIYPGAACDIPSQLYSYSFARRNDWSRTFAPQPEIQAYLRRVAQWSRTLECFLFGCALISARWERDHWFVETTKGDFTADILVTAFGALSEPARPAIDGLDSFAGPVFHTAQWHPDVELTGQRVAVIGTGASAIQVVASIVNRVAHLDVYQRTAPWVLRRRNRPYTRLERLAFRWVPGYQRLMRFLAYIGREVGAVGFSYWPGLLGALRRSGLAHLARQVQDPGLRARLTPDFDIGCKRILFSDEWYPALQRFHVELVTAPIASVTTDAITTLDGRSRPVDVIVVATGFRVTDSPCAELITGAGDPVGRTLAEHWREFGQQAYKGSTVAGFPNLFLLIGPNTGLGHNSMLYMIESQLNYLMDALDVIDQHDLVTVEVRRDAQAGYNTALQRRMRRTVWLTGCRSWYLDRHGRNTTLWPGFTFAFRHITRHFDLAAYRSTAREDASPEDAR